MSGNGNREGLVIIIPEHIQKLWQVRFPDIVQLGHPALRTKARPVGKPTGETRKLVQRMKAAMEAEHGMGLAAPQVGVDLRVIIYRLPEENAPFRVIVDPRIVQAKGEQVGEEGCLSIPYLHGDVKRAREIVVKGMDLQGRPIRRRASDLEARVIQHEVDHLDGVLFVDRAIPETLHWAVPETLASDKEPAAVE